MKEWMEEEKRVEMNDIHDMMVEKGGEKKKC